MILSLIHKLIFSLFLFLNEFMFQLERFFGMIYLNVVAIKYKSPQGWIQKKISKLEKQPYHIVIILEKEALQYQRIQNTLQSLFTILFMLRESKTVFFTLCDEGGMLKQFTKLIELKLKDVEFNEYYQLAENKINGKKVLNILEPGYQFSALYKNHNNHKQTIDQMINTYVEQVLKKYQSFDVNQKKEQAIKNYLTSQMFVFSKQGKLNDAPYELLKSSEIYIHPDITKFTSLNLLKALETYSNSNQREGK